jgi:hypothetical protein
MKCLHQLVTLIPKCAADPSIEPKYLLKELVKSQKLWEKTQQYNVSGQSKLIFELH